MSLRRKRQCQKRFSIGGSISSIVIFVKSGFEIVPSFVSDKKRERLRKIALCFYSSDGNSSAIISDVIQSFHSSNAERRTTTGPALSFRRTISFHSSYAERRTTTFFRSDFEFPSVFSFVRQYKKDDNLAWKTVKKAIELLIRPTLKEGRQSPRENNLPTPTFHSSAAQKRRNDTVHSSLVIIHEFFFSVRSRVVLYPISALALSYDSARALFLFPRRHKSKGS